MSKRTKCRLIQYLAAVGIAAVVSMLICALYIQFTTNHRLGADIALVGMGFSILGGLCALGIGILGVVLIYAKSANAHDDASEKKTDRNISPSERVSASSRIALALFKVCLIKKPRSHSYTNNTSDNPHSHTRDSQLSHKEKPRIELAPFITAIIFVGAILGLVLWAGLPIWLDTIIFGFCALFCELLRKWRIYNRLSRTHDKTRIIPKETAPIEAAPPQLLFEKNSMVVAMAEKKNRSMNRSMMYARSLSPKLLGWFCMRLLVPIKALRRGLYNASTKESTRTKQHPMEDPCLIYRLRVTISHFVSLG